MKILCVLYDDPKDGMPTSYPVKNIPKLENYFKDIIKKGREKLQ